MTRAGTAIERWARPSPGEAPQSNGVATTLAAAGAVAATAANFGIAVVVAGAGASFAGVFFAATALLAIAGNTAAMGTMTGLVYFMPAAVEGAEPNPRSLLALALRPVVAVGSLGAILLLLAAGPAAEVIAPQRASEAATLLRVLAPAVPALAASASLLGAARGLGSMTPTVTINQIAKPLAQLAAVAGVVLLSDEPSMVALGLAWCGPILASTGLAAAAVWRLGGFVGSGPVPVEPDQFWAFARPRAVSTGFQIALERLDVILVSALAGEAAAGIYGTISRYVTAGNFVVFAIAQATASGLRRALARERHDEAQRLLQQATGWMVLIAWPYFLLVATKPDTLIALVNPDFTTGTTALTVLALSLLVNAFAGPVDLALLMLGRARLSLAVTAAALCVDLALVWVLVPRLGIVGAAVAWGAAVVVQNVAAAVIVHRVGGLRGPGRPAVTAAIGAVLAVVPIAVLTPSGLASLAVCGIGAGLVLAAWAVRFAPSLDLPLPPVPGAVGAWALRLRRSEARNGRASR